MSKMLRVGLLGAGFIIDSHAKALKSVPNVEIIAVCDSALLRAQEAAKKYSIPHALASLEAMLKLELDVIHVLLPPDLHIETSRQILDAGISVFLEKPMGLDSVGCQSLVDLANSKGLKVGVNHNFLFLPAYEKLRTQVKDGTLGNLDQVTINWLYTLGLIQFGPFNNWMLREPKNLWFELGPHLVAFMLDLVGPLDELDTFVTRPADLPGGSRVYRKWHIHGVKGNTTVDLNMSVVPGFTDRSITLRGHTATAKCDFDRNVYCLDEPSGNGMLFDSFMTNMSLAKQLATNAFGNLIDSTKNTLKKSPKATSFGTSVALSIQSFYETFSTKLDSRVDGQFGVDVIAACETITRKAQLADGKQDTKVWTVLPPIKQPSILVIGGTGFIGKYLVKKLVESGHGVRVVTRSLAAGNIGLAGLPVELVQGDVAEANFLDKALSGIEVVYDLAKAVGSKWDDYYKHDVLVTKNIAERAIANGVKQLIYTGTIDSYYSANAKEVITSDTPLDPKIKNRNLYARSKATCEALLLKMHAENGLPVTIFRPGVVIGKGCPPAHWGIGMFQSETRVQFWGDGENKLPLVLVEDVAEALLLALGRTDITGKTFLLTDEPLLSGREYANAVSMAAGTKFRAEPKAIWKFFVIDAFKEAAKNIINHPNKKIPSYRDWDSRSHRARYDNTKTIQVLGWRPAGSREILIEKGIKAAVEEFMK